MAGAISLGMTTSQVRQREDAPFGGSLPLWIALTILGLGLLAVGLDGAPDMAGFLVMIVGGLILGVSYAEIISRLPMATHRYRVSIVLAVVVMAIVVAVLMLNASTLPVLPANPDSLLLPNLTAG